MNGHTTTKTGRLTIQTWQDAAEYFGEYCVRVVGCHGDAVRFAAAKSAAARDAIIRRIVAAEG